MREVALSSAITKTGIDSKNCADCMKNVIKIHLYLMTKIMFLKYSTLLQKILNKTTLQSKQTSTTLTIRWKKKFNHLVLATLALQHLVTLHECGNLLPCRLARHYYWSACNDKHFVYAKKQVLKLFKNSETFNKIL